MNFVMMFKPQFADLVRHGAKLQTVRSIRKRMPRVGDHISLREWPYRSKQRVLREATVKEIIPIEIRRFGEVWLSGGRLSWTGEWDFSRADGFNTPKDMYEWFAFTYGLPFKGVVISWEALK